VSEGRALDAEMRAVLAQLETCSHVPAAGWGPTGRSRSSDEHPGGGRPPGDIGHTYFARWYGPPFHLRTPKHPGCVTDDQRRNVLKAAKDELGHIRGGRVARPLVPGERREDWEKRMVKEGAGFTAKEVSIRFRCGIRDVWKVRERHDREREYGRVPEPDLDTQARRARVRELDGKGHTIAQIARLVGVHRSTVERDLGRRRAA
jgi:hypothetical protein